MSVSGRQPPVSVIIPCRNDATTLSRVLAALTQQTYPRDKTQIIVVDNGSRDGSVAVARAAGFEPLIEPRRSAYLARNRGIAAANGEYLLFLDADTVPTPEWIQELVKAAQDANFWLAGGRIENKVIRSTLGSALLALTRPAEHRQLMVTETGHLSGGNMLVARTAFETYGLFLPGQSGGDSEFAVRANPDKCPVPFAARAVVVHLCNITTWSYLKRAFLTAKGQAQLGGIHPPFPWRPGVRRVGDIHRQLPGSMSASWLSLWLILWVERWFFYAGYLAGRGSDMK